MEEVPPGYVAIGRVLAPWGLRGDLKVEPLTEPPYKLFSPGRVLTAADRAWTIERCQRRGRLVYLKLSGIADRGGAEVLRGHYLQVPESELEPLDEGQYYHFQLVGLSVRSSEGDPLGRVTSILATPGGDLLVVNGPLGETLVPAVDEIIREVDVGRGTMTIEAVPGLISPPRVKRGRGG